MGREIRRVPPGWEHPRYTKDDAPRSNCVGEYRPLFDKDYETAATTWLNDCIAWSKGEHPNQKTYKSSADNKYYWEWAGAPPESEEYRPKFDAEPTWYQVYETVTEGTPTTPPFATVEELACYLSDNGDFAYQTGYPDISPKPTYEQALKFIEQGSVPSGIMTGGEFKSTYDTVK